MKLNKILLNGKLSIILLLILGWFLTPIIEKIDFVRYVILTVSSFVPITYLLIKFIYHKKIVGIINLSYILGLILAIFPFSLTYHDLTYDNYYLSFSIPLVLNLSVVLYDWYETRLKGLDELIETITYTLPYIAVYLGFFILLKLIIGNTNPSWEKLSVINKSFSIFKVCYLMALALIFYSVRRKYISKNKIALKELLLIILLFCTYFFISIYLFRYENYLNGSYLKFLTETNWFIGISTLGIYSIILKDKQEYYSGRLRKATMVCTCLYCFLVLSGVFLDFAESYINTLINFKSLITIIISPVICSVISGLILHNILNQYKPKNNIKHNNNCKKKAHAGNNVITH